jgi:hypothetical protein
LGDRCGALAAVEPKFHVLLEFLELLFEPVLLILQFFDRAIGGAQLVLQAIDAHDQRAGVAPLAAHRTAGDVGGRHVVGLRDPHRRRSAGSDLGCAKTRRARDRKHRPGQTKASPGNG